MLYSCNTGEDHLIAYEQFVKTMKKDYIACMPKPNVRTALHNLAVEIGYYNENHPHSALGYLPPREYQRQRITSP
ncbi:transposase [Escherichia coli]|nr:hypothetical protein [Escherichia coli]RCP15076.1 hypothetical protein A6577_23835 [Escherichia coli]RCP28107.1 hypothetical protein A6680_23840 [Escherichia coli]UMS93905.1 hypothetical protein AOY65_04935 [Escherichia coli]HEA8781527.1 transposase [Escherichia coli]